MQNYRLEAAISLAVAFMLYYPPDIGVWVLFITSVAVVSLKLIESRDRKANPIIAQFEKDINELKGKIEQLILRGSR